MTDSASYYRKAKFNVSSHDTVNHMEGEYVRYEGDRVIHTNTAESYYSVFKRGMKGIYQHCAEKHLYQSAECLTLQGLNEAAVRH